jgi:hypothetical protein
MEHFEANRDKVFRLKNSNQMHRSSIKLQKYAMAAKRREESHSKHQTQGEAVLATAKENLFRTYKCNIDITNSKRNMFSNLRKMKVEEHQAQLEAALKLLTEKLQKIRNVKYGEKLDDNSLKIVLSYFLADLECSIETTHSSQLSSISCNQSEDPSSRE